MPFNGSGVFQRVYNWVSDKNSNINITASRVDTEDTGFATGLSNTICRDGQSAILANIPMSGFKFTGLGSGSATADSATIGQIQSQSTTYCGTSGGTANAQTLTPTPGISAYAAGQRFSFLPVATNTSGTVTIANSGLTARNVKKGIGGAKVILAVGDLIIAIPADIIDDGTDYILLNPQTYSHGADIASATTTVLDTATGDLIDITGTTTITAITLSEGRECTVRFTGILTLTNGASLILPGAANITTAAGDYAIFRGYASGVVRCVNYTKANGNSIGSTFIDSSFIIGDDGDATKKLAFQCSGITTGNTRTITIPDKSGTMAMLSDLITLGTAVPSTSGTSIDFTGIPSTAKRITINLVGVSTNGTSNYLFQIGAGSVTASGYLGAGAAIAGGAVTSANYTTGFGIQSSSAANIFHGSIILTTIGSNTWVANGNLGTSNGAVIFPTAGSISLAGSLDRVRITTAGGTDTFDAGSINIMYE